MDCKRINILLGQPNVGKSNLLEALSMYAVTSDQFAKNCSARQLLRIDALSHIFHNLNVASTARVVINNIDLTARYSKYAKLTNNVEEIDRPETVSVSLKVLNNDNPVDYLYRFTIDEKLQFKNRTFNNLYIDDSGNLPFPIRYIDRYIYNDALTGTQGSPYLTMDTPFGDNLFSCIFYDNELIEYTQQLLSQFGGLKMGFDDGERIPKIIKEQAGERIVIMPTNLLADTLKRLLFFTAAIKKSTNKVLLFEEPEAHFYPPSISKLVSEIVYDNNHNQFFITTHSPFVLNDFLEHAKEDLSLYLVSLINGQTKIKKLTDNEVHEAYQYGYDVFLNLEHFQVTD